MARDVILRFLSDTKDLKRGFSEASKGAQETEGVFARVSGHLGGISSQGVAAAAGFAGVATSIVGFATIAVNRLGEEEKAAAQTAAAIRSTGGAAQVTAGHVGTMATSLAKLSGVDDEVIQAGENLLLTFTNIQNRVGAGNDVFDQATKAALNMSVALGEDMSAAAIQLGKALNDPIGGVTALRRVGVQLSDQQKATVAGFVQTGDIMSAQKVILAELNKEFGGSAEAYGKTLPGAIGRARTAMQNWSADVAEKALPAVQSFAEGIGGIARSVGPPLLSALSKAGDVIVSVGKFAHAQRGYVIALAAAYSATLAPAIAGTVVAFGALVFAKIVAGFDLVITSARVLALEMGTLNLALSTLGIGVAVVGFGYLIERFVTADSKAKQFAASLKEGFDTSSLEGAQQVLINTYVELSKAQMQTVRQGNPIVDFFSFKGLDRHDAQMRAAALQEQADKLQGQVDMVRKVAREFGISTPDLEKFAKAQEIDLTGAVEETTRKLEEQYRAAQEATRGWTVYGLSVEDAAAIQKEVQDAFEKAADAVGVYSRALTAMQQASKDVNKAEADRVRDAAKGTRDAIDKRHNAEKAALDSEFITGRASKAAHDQRVKDLAARQRAEDEAADATVASENKRAQAIESTKVKTTLSMDEYRKAVDKNTTETNEWMKNLAIIAARGGGDFVGQLAQLGPEAAGLVAEVATSSKPKFDQFATTMRAAGKTAVDATAEELNKLPGRVQDIAKTSGQKFADTLLDQVAQGIKPLSDIVAKAAADALNAANAAAAGSANRGTSGPGGITTGPGGVVVAINPPGSAPGMIPLPPGIAGPPSPARHAEGHVAQYAPAGSWRVWAEPETGGEAYIPLAVSKRGRSTALVADVASRFGYGLVPMAVGGTWGVPVGGRGGSNGQRPNVGPFVFNEKVDPLHVARQIAWASR